MAFSQVHESKERPVIGNVETEALTEQKKGKAMIYRARITETQIKNGIAKQILNGKTCIPAIDEEDAKRRLCSREAARFLDGIDNEKLRKIRIDYPSLIKIEYVTGERLVIRIQEIEKDAF